MFTKSISRRLLSATLFGSILSLPFYTIARTQGSMPAAAAVNPEGLSTAAVRGFKMDSSVALGRTNRQSLITRTPTPGRRRGGAESAALRSPGRFGLLKSRISAQADATAGSISTGSGDIDEVEPNDQVAQNVFMPANISGQIRPSLDQDFFAFPCFAGEQINIEAFASRIAGSLLVADIGLFDSAGNLIAESVGDGVQDPLIQFVATSTGIMIAGITDADGFGGSSFVYLLSIDGGVDVDEIEPNDITPQALPGSAATVFGQLTTSFDTDLYSFSGTQGQTVIIDIDAAVLGSSLVSALTLTDSTTGIQYFSSDHDDGNDPRFNIVLPVTGAYVIGVVAIDGSPGGFYRMNFSLVPGDNSPLITAVTRVKAKVIDVNGIGLNSSSIVEVNGRQVGTTVIDKGDLNARSKAKPGAIVTVVNLPDLRRSNPLILQ